MDDKDKRIKELEEVALELYNLVHESDLIENKIKANDLYYIIKPKESKKIMENKIFTTTDSDDAVYNLVIELKIPFSKSNNIIMYPVTKEFTYMLSENQDEVIKKLYKENCIGGEQGYTWKLIEIN